MKRFFITSMFAWVALLVFSQDVIVKKDGSIVQAKVTKVGSSEVEYKKWSNIDGPSYCIDISEILAINYQNGEKDTFDKVSNSNNTPQQVSKPAAANNQNLIDSYKTDFHIKKQNKNQILQTMACLFLILRQTAYCQTKTWKSHSLGVQQQTKNSLNI